MFGAPALVHRMRSIGSATCSGARPDASWGALFEDGGSMTLAILYEIGEVLGDCFGDLPFLHFRKLRQLHTESNLTSVDWTICPILAVAWWNSDWGLFDCGIVRLYFHVFWYYLRNVYRYDKPLNDETFFYIKHICHKMVFTCLTCLPLTWDSRLVPKDYVWFSTHCNMYLYVFVQPPCKNNILLYLCLIIGTVLSWMMLEYNTNTSNLLLNDPRTCLTWF